jgi:hypothetical protein
MGYNKKVLSEATKKLNKPSKKKVANNDLIPFVSTSGYKQGEPPAGTNYRIPSNTIYNPTPYNILAVASTGEERIIPAGDTSNQTFDGAEYVDEYELKKGGQKTNTKKYSRSLSATNKLFDKNPLFKKPKSKKKKIFDPNAKYYQGGGETDSWGRKSDSPWYGFDPDKKQFTTKDQWGRSPGDEWYGFNPDNKTWTKGTKAQQAVENKQSQQERYKTLYEPLENKFYESIETDDDFFSLPVNNQDFIGSLFIEDDKRNIPPADPVLKEMQKKLLDLENTELKKLMQKDYSDISLTNFGDYIPSNVSYKDALKYVNHIQKLKKQGYTFQDGGYLELDLTPKEIEQYKKDGYVVEELPKAQTGKVVRCPEGYTYDLKIKKCVSDYERVEYGYPEGTDIRDLHSVHDIWPTEYSREFTHINQPIYIKPIQQKDLVYGAGDYQTINIYPDINYKLAVDPSKAEGYDEATNTYYVPSENTHQYKKYKEWEKAKELEKQNLAVAQELVNTGKFKLENINDELNKKVQENYANPAYIPEGLLPYDQFYKSGPKQRYESYLKTNCPECSFGHGESVYYDKDFVYRKTNPSLGGYESVNKSIKPIAKRIRENVEPSLVDIEKPEKKYRYGVWSISGGDNEQPAPEFPMPEREETSQPTESLKEKYAREREEYRQKNLQGKQQYGGVRSFQKGGMYYTYPGSEGVYRKVGNKWEVDWNRSGNFQPLSKGDVAERTAKLNKGAKQLFDQDYYDLVENRNQAFQSAPAKQVAKKPTAQQIAAQKVFDKDFKVTGKSNYEKVEDQIQKDIQEAKKLYEQSGLEWTKADEDEIANRRWNLSGVGTQYDPGVIQTPSKSTTYFNAPENPTFGDYAGKVWDIITNPIDYFNYSVATGDMMNAPWNITDYERALDKLGEEDPILSRNAVGKGLDFASYFNPATAALQAIKTAAEIPGLIGKARQTGDWSDAGWALGETALEMIPGMGAIDDITKGVKKVYNTAKPVAQTIGEGAYYFGKNVGESLTPGILRKYRKKSEKLAFERAELQDKSLELWKQNQEIERDIITAKYKLHQLKSNRTQDIATKQQIIKLQDKIDELSRLRNNAKLVDDKILYSEELSPYQQIGTMKSVVTDPGTGQNINYIYDFETKEKIPFDIQVPGQEVTLELKEGIPVKTEKFIPDFSFNPKYADTQNKNIAFVQKVLPGSKPFGSSVFHNIGVAHASNDIDVAMTASDWNKVKKNVSIDQSKQAKYGPTINLGDEFGSQGKIDVNIIQENPKTGMAEGEFATELFRQFFPDEFYKETQRLVEQGITKSINLKNLPSLSISKTPQELMDAYDPEIKSILDAYEATPQVRSGLNLNKTKQINRIDYILETSTDYNKVAKAQELFTKSIVGSKGSIGYQFSEDQLSDFSENLKILKDIGVTKHNLSKIASDPKRMQLFLNDFYINNSIYNREISLVPEYIKTPEDLFNAYTQWKGKGASAMGMGTNSVTLGSPKFANMDQDITGSIYYDLIKNKKYNTPKEYVDDIIKQTSGNRQLESAEVTQLKNIAEKYNIKIDEKKLPKTLGDLLDPETFGMTSIPEDVSNIDNFYKEAASLLGAKAIQRGFFAGSKYTTLLNDFDKKFDALTLSFNKYVPVLKSQTERFTNLANTSNLTNIGIIEKDYYKLKHYLDGGLDELVKKKNEALEFQKLFDEKIAKTAIQYASKKNPAEVERLLKERQDLNDKIITLTDTIDELNRRRDKIQIIRPGILLAVATAATGLGIYESSKSYKSDKKSKYKLELETLNKIEKETGKLSPQDEFRRKQLKKFITNKKEGGTHNIGDEIELTDEQVREWQRLGYTLEMVK